MPTVPTLQTDGRTKGLMIAIRRFAPRASRGKKVVQLGYTNRAQWVSLIIYSLVANFL